MTRTLASHRFRWLSLAAVAVAALLALPAYRAEAVPYFLTKDDLFEIRAFKLDTGSGSNDHDLNDTNETLTIWNAIDGGAVVPGNVIIGSRNYWARWWETDTETVVDYAGGGGDFGVNIPYSTINSDGPGGSGGGIVDGDDFSVRALAYLAVPVGTWSIAAGSDDGRRIYMPGLLGLSTPGFTAIGEQTGLGGVGQDVVGHNAPTGHDQTVGVFTVAASDAIAGTNIALLRLDSFFFERGGGDSFEISIKSGSDTSFGGSGEGWELLSGTGTLGWGVSSTPITISFTPDHSFTWDGSTDDWRAGAGTDTHWEPPAVGNTLYATITDDATVSAGQANVASSDEAALNLSIGGTGTVSVAAGRTLTVGYGLTIGAGGTLANDGTVTAPVISSSGTIALGSGSSLTANPNAGSSTLGDVDVLSGTASLSGVFTASTLDFAANTTLALTGGSLAVPAVSLAGGGTGTMDVASGLSVTLSNISGAGGLGKAGSGTLLLGTANSYLGQTVIDGGLVQVSANGALGTTAAGTVVNSPGSLRLYGGVSYTDAEALTLNGAGNAASGGALNNNGGNGSFAGPITLGSAALIQSDNNTLTLTGGINNAGYLLTVGGAGTTTISTTGISGGGGLAKNDAGTVILNTANSYSGLTTINAGILDVRNGDALGSTAAGTVVNSGGQLRLGVNNITLNSGEAISISGTGPGNGGAIYAQAGGNINIGGPVSLAGDALINVAPGASARLRLQGGLALGSNNLTVIAAGSGERFEVDAPITGSGSLRLEGDGITELRVDSPGFSGSVDITNGIADTYGNDRGLGTGTINVDGDATLRFRNGVNLVNNVTLNGTEGGGLGQDQGRLHNENNANSLQGTLAVNSYSRIDVNSGSTLTLAGVVSGSSAIEKTDAGRLELTNAANTFSGPLFIGGGTLAASSGGALASPSAITISGAALEVNGDATYAGSLTTNGATLSNNTAGTTLTLAGPVALTAVGTSLTFAGAGNITVVQGFGNGAAPTNLDGIEETLFDRQSVPGADPRNNIEGYRAATLEGNSVKGILTTHLHYNDDAAFDTRAAALGSAAWNPNDVPGAEDFSALWVTNFTPNESGAWGFRFNNVDDNASMWIDTTGTVGIFDATTDRFYDRGCCGGSGDRYTVALTAGQTYLLGIVMNDTGSGGYFRDMEFKAPSGPWTDLNPSVNPGLFQVTQTPNNSLVKTGTGTLTLAGNNSYNGTTTISQGTLVAAHNNALGLTTAGTTVADDATLAFQGGVSVGAEALTVGRFTAPGKEGIANLGGTNSFAGGITTTAGAGDSVGIRSDAGQLTLTGTVALGYASLTVDGNGDTVISNAISGGGTVQVSNYAAAVLGRADLRAYYRLNEAAGVTTVADSGPNGYTGTSEGSAGNNLGATSAYPALGTALHFDGSDDRILIPTAPTLGLNGSFTAMAWINVDVLSGDKTIFGTDTTGTSNGLHLITRGTKVHLGFYSNDTPGVQDLTAGSWYHVAWRYDAATQQQAIFINGALDNATGGHSAFIGTSDVRIGRWNSGNYFDGTIDEPAIFTSALSDADILDLYNQGPLTTTQTAYSNLVKKGLGILTLGGDNTYNGTTTVEAGTLLVNGTTSGQGNYLIQTGGTLGGTGSIGLAPGASVTFQGGSFLSPGTSPGTLTILGDVVLEDGTTYLWELGPTAYDSVALTGTLTLSNWVLHLIDAGGTARTDDKYYLFTGGTIPGWGNPTVDFSEVPLWAQNTDPDKIVFDIDDIGLYVTGLASTPEPATLTLLALGGLALLRRRKRNR